MRELRYAIRTLRRSPGFSAAAILTIALGIGAATTIFSVVYGVLLRPLPYRDPGRLVLVEAWQDYSGRQVRANYSLADVRPWQEGTRSFEATAFGYVDSQSLTTPSGSEVVDADIVTPGFFQVLGGRFALGRPFVAADDRSPVAVVSYRLWQRALGGTADAIGRPLVLNDHAYTIVGVADDAFRAYEKTTDVYLTSGFAQIIRPEDFSVARRGGGFNPIARLKPGVSVAQAQADTDAMMRALVAESATPGRHVRANVVLLRDRLVGDVRPALLMLFAAVDLVLVIACANVVNLLLTRNVSRAKEMAIRRAIGASPLQLARQSLAESAVIAAAGTAVGTLVAVWLSDALVSLEPKGLPLVDAIRVDLPVVSFAIAAALAATAVVGLLPAVQTPREIDALKGSAAASGPPRSRRLRASLVVVELAMSLMLLVGAALVGRSLLRLVHTDVGVPTDHVAAALVDLSFNRRVNEDAQRQIVERLVARVSGLPGVVHAGAGTSVPPNRSRARFTMRRDEATGGAADYMVDAVAVTPRFFSTLGVPLVRGRFFTDADDTAHAPVAVMTAATARELLGDVDPIGRTLSLPGTRPSSALVTVVGIVGDIKYSGLDAAAAGAVYRPFAQQAWPSLFVVARTTGDPAAALPDLRRTIAEIDPAIAVFNTGTLDGFIADAAAQPRFRTVVLAALAGLAVALAAVGLYGVVAYSVSQRTAEIGVRVALGAERGDVIRLVLRDAAWMALAGVAIGLGGALALARWLASLLYGVAPTDAASFAGSALCLLLVMLVASYLPARRAACVDPIVALREQ